MSSQIRALSIKNWRIKMRNKARLIMEFLWPLIYCGLIGWAFSLD